MKTIHPILLCSLLVILTIGCAPYGPRSFHAPLLNEKGDVHAAANLNMANGLEIQADYAWANHFYSPADFSFSFIQSGENGFRSNAYSLGIGYFTKMKNRGRFNLYLTPTYGNFGNSGSDYKSHFFGQTFGSDIGWRFNHFEAALSLKYDNFYYLSSNMQYDGNASGLGSAVTLRVGGDRFKFHTQFGVTYPLAGKYDFFPIVANFGLNYRINLKKKNG